MLVQITLICHEHAEIRKLIDYFACIYYTIVIL